jgi:hypothetical protein
MKFHYLSPSLIPSLSANSVHVMLQCAALVEEGVNVTLYAKRTLRDEDYFREKLSQMYGLQLDHFAINTFYSRISRANNFQIAMTAVYDLRRMSRDEVVLSRNLYAAFWLAVIKRRPLLFETHQLESGFRKYMQRMIMTRPWVKTIVISEMLKNILSEYHGIAPTETIVLHDAAPAGLERADTTRQKQNLLEYIPNANDSWNGICGYFGHLYAGRGVDIIELMARRRENILFVIFGGTDIDVRTRRQLNRDVNNLYFAGYVPHPVAQKMMRSVDILLMPYQEQVSIGVAGQDTARWMSPMKMFEYMAAGVPIISSDLPVLREVLRNGENALLVSPKDPAAWSDAVERVLNNNKLAKRLGDAAYNDYSAHHTWRKRAKAIIEAAKTL